MPGVTNPLYKGNGKKHELGAIDFIVYCVVSTLICFFLALFLIPAFLGGEGAQWTVALAIFLAIVPGFLIGAIIYNTQKHNSNKTATPTTNNQEAPRASSTTSISDKLIELKKLRDHDLITAEEFDKMKQEILKGLK